MGIFAKLMDLTLLGPIGAFIAGLGTAYAALSMRGKNENEGAMVITEAAKNLIDPLNKRIDELSATVSRQSLRITELEHLERVHLARIDEISAGIELLSTQIRSSGKTPLYTLSRDDGNGKK